MKSPFQFPMNIYAWLMILLKKLQMCKFLGLLEHVDKFFYGWFDC